MIDESLLKSNFTGRDGFTWWIGRVANHKFWKQTDEIMTQSGAKGHRVKVRIIGYHPWNTEELPENDLPWAEVLNSPNVGSGQLTRGETMNLVGGETAVGFFMDGEEAQQPVIFGLLHRQGNVPDSIKPQEAAVGKTGFEVHTGVELQKPLIGCHQHSLKLVKTILQDLYLKLLRKLQEIQKRPKLTRHRQQNLNR